MQTFEIDRLGPVVRRRVEGRLVDTSQSTVRFPDGDTTRHLQRQDGNWTGWNSDSARRERAGILESHAAHQATAIAAQTRVQKLTDALGELKGKRGAEHTAERKMLREALKSAKAAATVAAGDLATVAEYAGRVDETHPEKVEFVA